MTRLDLKRRLVAESLGTAILVATVVGSGIMAAKLTKDIGLALLGNTLPTGAILVVLVLIFGPVSGAHFNPAVSLVMAQRARMPWSEVGPYVVTQTAGGILGSLVAHIMFELPLWQASQTVRAGGAQWFAEFVATFGLVLTIFGVVRFRPESAPLAVGLYITAAYWFTASTSFANPAVTIARALTDTFAGIAPASVPAFVVAQIVGAFAASFVSLWLFSPQAQEGS